MFHTFRRAQCVGSCESDHDVVHYRSSGVWCIWKVPSVGCRDSSSEWRGHGNGHLHPRCFEQILKYSASAKNKQLYSANTYQVIRYSKLNSKWYSDLLPVLTVTNDSCCKRFFPELQHVISTTWLSICNVSLQVRIRNILIPDSGYSHHNNNRVPCFRVYLLEQSSKLNL